MDFKEATDLLSPSMVEIAHRIGRQYPSIMTYRNGTRKPPPEILALLAAVMREQALWLIEAAEKIEAEALARD